MKITIAARFKPFSHTPGASCVIPGTCAVVEAFPTLLRIHGTEWKMPLTGPVKNFTLEQNLEKNCVFVHGKAKEGYFLLKICAHDAGFEISSLKGPLKSGVIQAKIPFVSKPHFERLSLGSHKSQDWDLIVQREHLEEMVPLLFCLGQKTPRVADQPITGTAHLLKWPEDRNKITGALLSFFHAAFKGILVPRLFDEQHQGLAPEDSSAGDPFFLIQEGAKQIRSLFFVQNERRLSFLPSLPTSFHAGRMVCIEAFGIGSIDFEWSKKILKKVCIRSETSGEVLFDLQKEIKTFRVNKKKRMKSNEPLLLESGKKYFLDRFEK